MAIPSRFTKVKIAAGYTLLLVVLLLSLLFVHREMEKLSDTDDVQSLQTDSLLLLLKEKDENTIRMLQIINEANESMKMCIRDRFSNVQLTYDRIKDKSQVSRRCPSAFRKDGSGEYYNE